MIANQKYNRCPRWNSQAIEPFFHYDSLFLLSEINLLHNFANQPDYGIWDVVLFRPSVPRQLNKGWVAHLKMIKIPSIKLTSLLSFYIKGRCTSIFYYNRVQFAQLEPLNKVLNCLAGDIKTDSSSWNNNRCYFQKFICNHDWTPTLFF